MIPKVLFLIKQIRPRRAEVDDLGTAIAILFEARAFEAVESVTNALAAADDALVLIVAEGALVADAHEGGRAHIRIANGALAVALVAQPAQRNARLLSAHDEVGVVAGHWHSRREKRARGA